MSEYQQMIILALQNGAKLQSSEGTNYKCWLNYPNGERKNVRRDSAEKVCDEYQDSLVFGEMDGIRWKKPKRITQPNHRSPFGMFS